MKIYEKLLKDKRFYINPYDFERIIKRKIISYSFIEIPVGKIRRYLDGKIFDLYDTDAYKLLDNPKSKKVQQQYDKYCEEYCYEYEKRSKEKFKKLVVDIIKEEYDPQKGVIVVDQLYIIADGQHRACILLKNYGPDYKIKVLKINCIDIGIKTYIRNFIYDLKKLKK